MNIHASFWAYIASLVVMGIVCRRWPSVALFGALSAFGGILQAHLIPLPCDPLVVFADSILFALPTVALVRACGLTDEGSIVFGAIVPLAMGVDERFGSDLRCTLLILGVGAAQGFAGVLGLHAEMKAKKSNLERRAAICLSFVGVLGLLFVDVWHDVAWCGVAAHAFACLAYLAEKQR